MDDILNTNNYSEALALTLLNGANNDLELAIHLAHRNAVLSEEAWDGHRMKRFTAAERILKDMLVARELLDE